MPKRSQVLNCRLLRKRCKCGKQVKASQLIQYGMCEGCFAQAASAAESSKATSA